MLVVYSYYVMDILHHGHLQMMKNAKKIAGEDGILIVGILTDEATMEKKKKPLLIFEERMAIADAIKYIDVVVPQTTYSPLPNCEKIQPNILMESTSHTDEAIQEGRKTLAKWGGDVVVLPYYPGICSTNIKKKMDSEKNGQTK